MVAEDRLVLDKEDILGFENPLVSIWGNFDSRIGLGDTEIVADLLHSIGLQLAYRIAGNHENHPSLEDLDIGSRSICLHRSLWMDLGPAWDTYRLLDIPFEDYRSLVDNRHLPAHILEGQSWEGIFFLAAVGGFWVFLLDLGQILDHQNL